MDENNYNIPVLLTWEFQLCSLSILFKRSSYPFIPFLQSKSSILLDTLTASHHISHFKGASYADGLCKALRDLAVNMLVTAIYLQPMPTSHKRVTCT